MLNFFDKLKTIFKIRDFKISPTFKFFSDNKSTNILVINDKKTLEGVNLAALTKEQREQVSSLITTSEKGTTFLTEGTTLLLDEAKTVLDEKVNTSLIIFFEKKIPSEDLRILKSALVIREKFERGEHVGEYRRELAQIYGQKAYTICNLVTAGYFENFLIPLYNSMAKEEGFEIEDFTKSYIKLIKDFPLAIFVNGSMTLDEVSLKIKNRIEENKKYEVPFLDIHGIGRANIETIERVVDSLKSPEDYTVKSIENRGSIILVKLRFD